MRFSRNRNAYDLYAIYSNFPGHIKRDAYEIMNERIKSYRGFGEGLDISKSQPQSRIRIRTHMPVAPFVTTFHCTVIAPPCWPCWPYV